MLKTVSVSILLLAVSWMALHYLTKVGKADVIAYKAYQRPVGAGHYGFLPGDVVVLYQDGDMERICDLQLETETRKVDTLESTYVNSLGQSLPFLVAVGHAFRDMLGLPTPESGETVTATAGVFNFNGFERALNEVDHAGLSEQCACQIARRSFRGERVCTINAALIETRQVPTNLRGHDVQDFHTRTVAVTLARHTNYLPEQSFAACGFEFNDQAQRVQQELCNDGEVLPLDVRMRRRLNLIEERPFGSMTTSFSGP